MEASRGDYGASPPAHCKSGQPYSAHVSGMGLTPTDPASRECRCSTCALTTWACSWLRGRRNRGGARRAHGTRCRTTAGRPLRQARATIPGGPMAMTRWHGNSNSVLASLGGCVQQRSVNRRTPESGRAGARCSGAVACPKRAGGAAHRPARGAILDGRRWRDVRRGDGEQCCYADEDATAPDSDR